MQVFPAGEDATLIIPLVDRDGIPFDAIDATVRVLDADEAVLATFSNVGLAGATDADIRLPASLNETTAVEDLRTVEILARTATGTVTLRESYILQRAAGLVVLQNSFQALPSAELTARGIHGLFGWETADPDTKRRALIEAFERIKQLTLRVVIERNAELGFDRIPFVGEILEEIVFNHRTWPLVTKDIWEKLPADFVTALKRAQVAEAENLLTGDVAGQKRRQGILSESIGESSMMFRSGKPMDFGISPTAFGYLQGFVSWRRSIGRA